MLQLTPTIQGDLRTRGCMCLPLEGTFPGQIKNGVFFFSSLIMVNSRPSLLQGGGILPCTCIPVASMLNIIAGKKKAKKHTKTVKKSNNYRYSTNSYCSWIPYGIPEFHGIPGIRTWYRVERGTSCSLEFAQNSIPIWFALCWVKQAFTSMHTETVHHANHKFIIYADFIFFILSSVSLLVIFFPYNPRRTNSTRNNKKYKPKINNIFRLLLLPCFVHYSIS